MIVTACEVCEVTDVQQSTDIQIVEQTHVKLTQFIETK